MVRQAHHERVLGARTEGCTPERRRVLRVVEALNVVFLVVDLALHGAAPLVVGGRLLVSAALGALDLTLGVDRLSGQALRWALCGLAVAVVAGFGLLCLGTGGGESPYLTFVAFLSIVVGMFVPDEPVVNLVTGAAAAVVGVGFAAAARSAPAQLGFVAAAHASCTFYGAASAALYRRMRRRERVARAAQAEAAAALTRSELQRAASARAAAVGRVAAELGHELSSPVASASANLRFLEEELPHAGVDRELVEAARESRHALERVGRVVGDLRVLTPDEPWNAGDVDLLRAIEHGLQLAEVRLGATPAVVRRLAGSLPPVQASARHLAQVVSILVAVLAEGDPDGDGDGSAGTARGRTPVALEVAMEDGHVKLAFTGPAATSAGDPAPERAGVGVALCRALAEPWGGRVDARPIGGGRLELALRLRPGAVG